MPRLLQLFAMGGALVCASLDLAGATVTSSVFPDLHFSSWQAEDGLPSNKIMDVLQTREGFIWIASHEGLTRFDGVRFTIFNSSNTDLHDTNLTCLYESKDGGLWIGHENGAVTHYQDGHFETKSSSKNQLGGKTRDIGADEMGDLWTLSDSGLLTRLKDGFTLKPEPGDARNLIEMACSEGEGIWVSSAGRLSALKAGQITAIPLGEGPDSYVQGICAARDGGIWVASSGRIRKYKDGKWSESLGPMPFGGVPIHTFLETKRGQLVAGTSDHGFYIIPCKGGGEVLQLSRANGFAADWVISLCEDREGGLWIGTGSAGLFMMRHEKVTTVVPPDRWQDRAVLSVCPAGGGGLWVGTEGAGLYRLKEGKWENFAKSAGIRNPYIWSVLEDSHGGLWAGTWGGSLYTKTGEDFAHAPGLEAMSTPMPAISEARQGGLWVGTGLGLMHYLDGQTSWIEEAPEYRLRDVRAVVEDRDGTVWFGSNGDGLGASKNHQIRHFKKSDGLANDFVQCLHLDADGALWIGTFGGGITRLKNGKFSTIGIKQGLSDAVICHIEEDADGFFWISSHGGIMRLSKAEMDQCADGLITSLNCISYGLSEGMPTLKCSGGMQPAGCKTADGNLAFATGKGLVIVDPRKVETNPLPPPVVIEGLKVDENELSAVTRQGNLIVIGPGPHRLEFQYTGLSFTAPERVRFKRRLFGLESEWVDAGTQRSADYNYLPPGDYRFQVTACNNDGVWNDTGTAVSLRVLPFFWQTIQFKLLVLVALLAVTGSLVWLETRRRMQRKLATLEQRRAIELERARIASDMHDDLGSHLTRITMLSETARSGINDTESAVENLKQIYSTARGITRAMDEIVWAVNPKRDTMDSLVSYLEKYALDFLGAAGIRCRLELPLEFPSWAPNSEVRHNLFLAFKEALNNVAKHAAADLVTFAFEVSESDYKLTVQDNGRGFEVPTSQTITSHVKEHPTSGNGLENMRRRLERINGRYEVSSAPGHGTKVTLIVPATVPPKN